MLAGVGVFREFRILFGCDRKYELSGTGDGSMMDIFGKGGGEKLAQQSGVPFLGANTNGSGCAAGR
jgi:hypothetical protein